MSGKSKGPAVDSCLKCGVHALEVANKPSVLLVEDNPINQDAASLLLTEMGCLVDVAFNGVQALEKCLRRTYDLILMDCQMPLMDGLTATSRIRSHELTQRLRRTPIVAITANVQPADRQVCLDAGMDDYLPKPFRRSQVKKVLQRFFNTPHRSRNILAVFNAEHIDSDVNPESSPGPK